MRNVVIFVLVSLFAWTTSPAIGQSEPTDAAKQALAQLDGEIRLPGLKEPVEILRDRWGVPHIYAKSADDLFFAQGFVAAQDRLFQLDLWRRGARGEMAEVVGPKALEADVFARLIRYRGDMKAEWESYAPDTRRIAIAFTNGINACIERMETRLPIEFGVLGCRPKPWQPEDILGRMSGIAMTRNFTDEILRAHLIDKLGLDKVRQLMPTDPIRDFAPAPGLDLAGIDSRILQGFHAATKSALFAPAKSASNNWVVSSNLSASGQPLLASDPHRSVPAPSLRYLVHLHAPGWNVIGAGEPALPGVAIGHNDRIAWGFTTAMVDHADVFVEETQPGNPAMYKVGADWQPMRIVKESISVKGKAEPHEVVLRFTRHGPVLHQDDKKLRAFALRWTGDDPGGGAYLASLAVGRATNPKEFLDALGSWRTPTLNFVYADKDGNIGWAVAAAGAPIRPKHDGLLPVPGNGGYEWSTLPAADLPRLFNPKSGWLATANHNMIPAGYEHDIGFEFAPPFRFLRIKERLEAKRKFDLKDFESIQQDPVSIPGRRLAKLLEKLDLTDPTLESCAKIMRRWDGALALDSQAGPIYAYWLPHLEEAVFGRHVPKEFRKSVSGGRSSLPLLLQVLEQPSGTWFGDHAKEVRDEILRSTFAAAVGDAKKRFPDPAQMRWGAMRSVTFRHVLSSNPELAKVLDVGPFERPGDVNTPNNTKYDDAFQQVHGASYRQIFDLADWDKGLATSAPGQSGQPGSPHYADLAPLWAEGRYFPLAYSRSKVEELTRHRLWLQPVK